MRGEIGKASTTGMTANACSANGSRTTADAVHQLGNPFIGPTLAPTGKSLGVAITVTRRRPNRDTAHGC